MSYFLTENQVNVNHLAAQNKMSNTLKPQLMKNLTG